MTLIILYTLGILPPIEIIPSILEIDVGRQLLIRCESVGNFSGKVMWLDENGMPGK